MRVLIVGDSPESRGECRQIALGAGLDCGPDDCVSFGELRLRLARYPDVHLVLVLLEPDPAAASRAVDAVRGRSVVVVTKADVPPEGDGAIRVWSIVGLRERLAGAADDIRAEQATAKRRGRVIAVTAALPGTGATTIATGIAFALAGTESVVLAEFGAPVPELSLNLELKPPHSVGDLLRAGDRMDVAMIRHAAVRHPAGVDVLCYPPDTLSAAPLTPAAVREFNVLLRSAFDWVVIDAGHSGSAQNAELCRRADAVVVVTRLAPTALRLTRGYLASLGAAGVPDAAIALTANHYGQPGQIAWRKAEAALAVPVKAWFPDDPRAVNQALAEGRPLAVHSPRSALARELAKFAAEVRAKFTTAG